MNGWFRSQSAYPIPNTQYPILEKMLLELYRTVEAITLRTVGEEQRGGGGEGRGGGEKHEHGLTVSKAGQGRGCVCVCASTAGWLYEAQ